MNSPLEEKAASVRQDLDLEFQKWAKIFSPIENPARDASLVFRKSDTDFLDKQDPNCIWPIFSVWKLYGTEYLLSAFRYDEGYDHDTEFGYLVTKKPYLGLDDPLYDDWSRGVTIANMVTCVMCGNDEPDCHFCSGQPAILVSMVGELSED